MNARYGLSMATIGEVGFSPLQMLRPPHCGHFLANVCYFSEFYYGCPESACAESIGLLGVPAAPCANAYDTNFSTCHRKRPSFLVVSPLRMLETMESGPSMIPGEYFLFQTRPHNCQPARQSLGGKQCRGLLVRIPR